MYQARQDKVNPQEACTDFYKKNKKTNFKNHCSCVSSAFKSDAFGLYVTTVFFRFLHD